MKNERALFRHPEPNPEALAQSHEVRAIELNFDPSASFVVPVPRTMVTARPSRHIPEAPGRPMPLAVFGEPPKLEGPQLRVSAQTLRWEVDPLEWLRWQGAPHGWRVALARRHPGPKGPRYELGALREKDGRVEVRRTMAIRSGARLLRCDAVAPLSSWSKHHDALWHARRLDARDPSPRHCDRHHRPTWRRRPCSPSLEEGNSGSRLKESDEKRPGALEPP